MPPWAFDDVKLRRSTERQTEQLAAELRHYVGNLIETNLTGVDSGAVAVAVEQAFLQEVKQRF